MMLYWSDGIVKHLILQFSHIHSFTSHFMSLLAEKNIKDEEKMCNLKQTACMY